MGKWEVDNSATVGGLSEPLLYVYGIGCCRLQVSAVHPDVYGRASGASTIAQGPVNGRDCAILGVLMKV